MSEFKIPPISTLIGSGPGNFVNVIRAGGKIDPAFYKKLVLTTLAVFGSSPFHLWEHVRFNSKVKRYKFSKEPLFILGHWRSGTTLLHNLLCTDPDAGYFTTYHSVFPDNLASKFIYKNFMKSNMPDKRPSDNVKLGIDLPQEDEFAIGNLTMRSFYHFFYFPEKFRFFYAKAVEEVNAGVVPGWDETYRKLIIKSLLNTGGQRAVVKNPVNTARITTLLRMFPDAKFIYIYRNPVTVYLSTQKFFNALFPTLWFHKVSREFIDELIFENFRKIINEYDRQKSLIPEKNLYEIRFEDFEKQPLIECRHIYENLLQENFEMKSSYFEKYLEGQKDYSKNKYDVPAEIIDRVYTEWGGYMKQWNYETPEHLNLT